MKEESRGEPIKKDLVWYAKNKSSKLEYFLQKGHLVNVKGKNGYFCLHHLCDKNDIENVELLFKYNARPNVRDNNHNTPLHYSNSKKLTKILLENGANPFIKNIFGNVPNRQNSKYMIKNFMKFKCQEISDHFNTFETKLFVASKIFKKFLKPEEIKYLIM